MALNNVDNYNGQAGAGRSNEMVLNGAVRSDKVLLNITNTVTLAELNAGKTIISGVAGRTINVKNFRFLVNGTFTTGTSVELEDTNGSPVAVASVATAGLGDGAVILADEANTTVGAGFLGALTAGEGLAVTATGTFAGGTDITVAVEYTLT